MESLTDDRAAGFSKNVEPLRYAGINVDPLEAQGFAASAVRSGSRILDVGCGTGHFAAYLRNVKGCEVVGFEPNVSRAECAKGLGLDVQATFFTPETARNLGRFDHVLFMDVLEHMDDPFAVVCTAAQVLAPGGNLIVSVPNVAHWSVRKNLLLGRFDYRPTGIMDATHVRWFTRKTLDTLLEEAGLEIVNRAVSRGLWDPVYYVTVPWRFLAQEWRRGIVDYGCRVRPTLFGTQLLAVARAR